MFTRCQGMVLTVGAVSYEYDIRITPPFSELTPTPGNNCSYTAALDSLHNCVCHLGRILHNNASKSDIYRRRSNFKEGSEMHRRGISRLFTKEEPTDIYNKLKHLIIAARTSYRIPMYEGQSNGFGTSAGDQQYVNGTSKSSDKLGPAAVGIGSKSSVFSLQLLIISANLKSYLSAI